MLVWYAKVCVHVCVDMYVCVNHVNLFQMLLVTLKMHDVSSSGVIERDDTACMFFIHL